MHTIFDITLTLTPKLTQNPNPNPNTKYQVCEFFIFTKLFAVTFVEKNLFIAFKKNHFYVVGFFEQIVIPNPCIKEVSIIIVLSVN